MTMESNLKGIFYIIFGIFIIFFAASEFLIRALIFFCGLYLIYRGLQLRNANQILFYVHRFKDRF